MPGRAGIPLATAIDVHFAVLATKASLCDGQCAAKGPVERPALCNGGGRNVQPMCKGIAGHPILLRPTENQNGLEVVVNGFAVRVQLTAGLHGSISGPQFDMDLV